MSNGGFYHYLTPFLRDVLTILQTMAAAGVTLTYEELVESVKAFRGSCSPHFQMGAHLGRLSHWERAHGRPIISAIVVNRDGTVGPGFWKMVEDEMGIPVLDRDEFLNNAQRSVFGYWRSRR